MKYLWQIIKRFFVWFCLVSSRPHLGYYSPPCQDGHNKVVDCKHYIRCVGGTYRNGPYMNLFKCIYCGANFWFNPEEPK